MEKIKYLLTFAQNYILAIKRQRIFLVFCVCHPTPEWYSLCREEPLSSPFPWIYKIPERKKGVAQEQCQLLVFLRTNGLRRGCSSQGPVSYHAPSQQQFPWPGRGLEALTSGEESFVSSVFPLQIKSAGSIWSHWALCEGEGLPGTQLSTPAKNCPPGKEKENGFRLELDTWNRCWETLTLGSGAEEKQVKQLQKRYWQTGEEGLHFTHSSFPGNSFTRHQWPERSCELPYLSLVSMAGVALLSSYQFSSWETNMKGPAPN